MFYRTQLSIHHINLRTYFDNYLFNWYLRDRDIHVHTFYTLMSTNEILKKVIYYVHLLMLDINK